MHKGWIKLHRKILHSDMYKVLNSKQRDVMIACLLLANHTGNQWEYGGEIYTCEPGQFITSIEKLREYCANDVKTQSIRTALLKLETWGFLTKESTKQNSIITICNWDTYQGLKDETNKGINKDLTNDQQSSNKELTTNKNNKELKNDKEHYKPELKARDQSSERSDYFIKIFNETKGSPEKPTKFRMNNKLNETLKQRVKEGYSSEDFIKAITNCKKDDFHIQNGLKHLTPEFILRSDKLEKFLNADPVPTSTGVSMTNAEKRRLGLIPQLE